MPNHTIALMRLLTVRNQRETPCSFLGKPFSQEKLDDYTHLICKCDRSDPPASGIPLKKGLKGIGSVQRSVRGLLYVREFIAKNQGFTDPDFAEQHGVDFLFSCHIPDAYAPQVGDLPDPHQAGVAWLLDVVIGLFINRYEFGLSI